MNRIPFALLTLFLPLFLTSTVRGSEAPDITVETASGWIIHVHSDISPLRINEMHSWRIKVLDSESEPVTNASISIEGGMPDHDHGLPTRPRITSEIRPGTYLLQGIRFHKPGKWECKFIITTGTRQEIGLAEFEL